MSILACAQPLYTNLPKHHCRLGEGIEDEVRQPFMPSQQLIGFCTINLY